VELLGKAKMPAVCPCRNGRLFAAAVKGECPRCTGPGVGDHGAFALPRQPGLLHPTVPQNEQMTLLAQKVSASPDYDVISHLDELLDSEENSVWLDGRGY
jgi:hypothetical protein